MCLADDDSLEAEDSFVELECASDPEACLLSLGEDLFSRAVDADVPDFSDVEPVMVDEGVGLSDCLIPVAALEIDVFSVGEAASALSALRTEPVAEAVSDFDIGAPPPSV